MNDECKDQICLYMETINHCDDSTVNKTTKTEKPMNE